MLTKLTLLSILTLVIVSAFVTGVPRRETPPVESTPKTVTLTVDQALSFNLKAGYYKLQWSW